MTKKLGVLMDPIQHINIKKDSTFAMLLEAQHRGYELFYLEQKDVMVKGEKVYGNMRKLSVKDDEKNWFTFLSEPTVELLSSLSLLLMRKDPPFDIGYIYTTYLLELAEKEGLLVVNKPQSLRDANEKFYTTHFPQCCPPMVVSSQKDVLKEFVKTEKDVILKPLEGMGGKSIFRVTPEDPNINVIIETLTQLGELPIMAQRYIPEISEGDKRVLMINGNPIPFALARMAAPGETRANLAAGGKGKTIPLSKRDLWICQQVGPTLREKGLYFVGLDIIGDYLTEINVTSPTCIREIDKEQGLNIAEILFDALESIN